MKSEERWCPACGLTTTSSDSWDCSVCGTRLWTHEMIWRELREALSLRPPSKGAKYAEAGRLRLDLYHSQQRVAQLEAELAEREPAVHTVVHTVDNSQLRATARDTIAWLRKLAKGSSPKKSVLLADLNKHIGELQAGLKEER
jgi:hypothetical protein